jgi:SEC-C motif-containing protein
MSLGRNEPCPCGSGKKYKSCCLPATQRDSEPAPSISGSAELQARLSEIREFQKSYGQVKPVLSAEFKQHRFVAIGNKFHWSEKWKTFPDFLFAYLKIQFGREWWQSEVHKAAAERHPIVQWCFELGQWQKQQVPEVNGLFRMPRGGVVAAYLLAAYDLFVLDNHQRLQARIIDRLKNRDQFQGARYELLVTATLIRAGFEIDFEDESDSTRKHPEFLATHRATGEVIAVEAKSRHRPGILGRDGDCESPEQLKLGVRRLLNKAAEKTALHPMVIFVDLNMPQTRLSPHDEAWHHDLREDVGRLGIDAKGQWPFALAAITNFPYHYQDITDNEPIRLCNIIEPVGPQRAIQNRRVIEDIERSLGQFGTVPRDFDEDFKRL